jgi:hypothetical protein
MEQERHHELLWASIAGLGLWVVSFLAFSKKQRDSIVNDRDGGRCLAPFKHTCVPEKLELHHCTPQRYGFKMGLDEETLDVPENAISLCVKAHDVIHPDRVAARQNYHQDKAQGINSFEKLGEERAKKLEERTVYWNTEHDRAMRVIAMRQTQEAKKKGWIFPSPPKKRSSS